ncbi:MAG TPA: AtpZ/AtpI family protein [Anaerolineales bacterium]
MNQESNQTEKNRFQYAFNLALAAVAGQVGCLTLVIVLLALFGGLWLDSYFKSKPMFTIGLTIASVPVTLVAMFWVVKTATSRIAASSKLKPGDPKEEIKRG